MAGMPLPPMERRKEVLLDRWHSHTAQCKTCQRVRCPAAAMPCQALHGRRRHAAGLSRTSTLLIFKPCPDAVGLLYCRLFAPTLRAGGRTFSFRLLMTRRLITQGFKLVKAAQLAMVALAAVLAWGLAAALGQGAAPLSKVSACILVGERCDSVPMRDVALAVCAHKDNCLHQ